MYGTVEMIGHGRGGGGMAQRERISADAGKLAANAVTFIDAFRRLGGPLGIMAPLTVPTLVLGWLSVELLLKALAQVGSNSFLKTHHVDALFFDLPVAYQEEIVRHYEHGMAVGSTAAAREGLIRHLIAARSDFVDARYVAEVFSRDPNREFMDPMPIIASMLPLMEAVVSRRGIAVPSVQMDRTLGTT